MSNTPEKIDRGRWVGFSDDEIYLLLRGIESLFERAAGDFAKAGLPSVQERAQSDFELLYNLIKELRPIDAEKKFQGYPKRS